MNVAVTIDWRFMAAIGASAAGIILVTKLDATSAEWLASRAVDAFRECVAAVN